jgi:hypothetical protein
MTLIRLHAALAELSSLAREAPLRVLLVNAGEPDS